jgi:hypothetical protein
MSFFHSPRIVTDGLVFYLDAANSKSYPGTGTDWFDLSGNGNDGTLTNTPTYSTDNLGYFDFDDASTEYVDIGATTGLSSLTKATFVAWVYRDGAQIQYTGIIFSRGSSVTGMNTGGNSDRLGYHWNSLHFSWDSGLVIPDATWSMVALSVDGGGNPTDATAYVFDSTGVSSSTHSDNHVATTLDDLDVGRDDLGGREWDGRIAQALIYDRALTQAELTINFNSMRGRYGI